MKILIGIVSREEPAAILVVVLIFSVKMSENGQNMTAYGAEDYVEICQKLPESGDVRTCLRGLIALNCAISQVRG